MSIHAFLTQILTMPLMGAYLILGLESSPGRPQETALNSHKGDSAIVEFHVSQTGRKHRQFLNFTLVNPGVKPIRFVTQGCGHERSNMRPEAIGHDLWWTWDCYATWDELRTIPARGKYKFRFALLDGVPKNTESITIGFYFVCVPEYVTLPKSQGFLSEADLASCTHDTLWTTWEPKLPQQP